MSFVDRRMETRPATGEAPFHLDEVFFSRTDDRGVILSSNYVFQRVANFEWDELIGAPHKLIRHPDMPKGVFWLLWDTIKQGKPIGAYVKNLAKDGLYYWVFATVVPCEGGYLSARIKPSTPLHGLIEAEYAEFLKAEQTENLSPEDSAKRVLARLQELGFANYQQFAAHALSEELIARDEGLGNDADPKITGFRQMHSNAVDLAQETEALVQEFEAMRTIPHNLRVIASRIEPAGGPVTVLSQNYGTMSREMSEWFAKHVLGEDSNFASIKGIVDSCMFVECMVRILLECDEQLKEERRKLSQLDMETERTFLSNLVSTRTAEARKGLKNLNTEADRILNACSVMQRHFLALSSTRVLCKIESARLPETGEALTDIIDQLGAFQERISGQLDRIANLSSDIKSE